MMSWWGKDTDQNISARSLTLFIFAVGCMAYCDVVDHNLNTNQWCRALLNFLNPSGIYLPRVKKIIIFISSAALSKIRRAAGTYVIQCWRRDALSGVVQRWPWTMSTDAVQLVNCSKSPGRKQQSSIITSDFQLLCCLMNAFLIHRFHQICLILFSFLCDVSIWSRMCRFHFLWSLSGYVNSLDGCCWAAEC